MSYPWHLYLMVLLYVIAGIMHLVRPKMYQRILPNYLPQHKLLVVTSGIVEICLGIALCFTVSKNAAIYALIAMLICFLPVHFYMLCNERAAMKISKWILVLRIPLQFALMYWAYYYLRF